MFGGAKYVQSVGMTWPLLASKLALSRRLAAWAGPARRATAVTSASKAACHIMPDNECGASQVRAPPLSDGKLEVSKFVSWFELREEGYAEGNGLMDDFIRF